jgi:hypothetical protein
MAVNSGGIPAAEVDKHKVSGEAESTEGRERGRGGGMGVSAAAASC